MARRRMQLDPRDATNDGSRRLREILRRRTFAAVALDLLCDEGAVRRWAHEKGKPCAILRTRAHEHATIAIPFSAWDEPPSKDVYVGCDSSRLPATEKRRGA
jgi:hypothetical protein